MQLPPPRLIQFQENRIPGLWPGWLGQMSAAWVPGVTITSWYRDKATNAQVGGLPDSQHLYGWALDLRKDEAGRQMAERASRSRYLEVLAESDHYHIEFRQDVAAFLKALLVPTEYSF